MDQYNAEIIPLMKHWFSVYLDQWLWGEKLDGWEDGMDELERRIYISHLAQRGLVVRAKFRYFIHARGQRFRTAVSKA